MTQLNDNFAKLDQLSTKLSSESHSYDSFLEFIVIYEECNQILNELEKSIFEQREKLESYWGKHSEKEN